MGVEGSDFAAAAGAHGCTARPCAVCRLVLGSEVTSDERTLVAAGGAGIAIALDLGVSLVCSGRGISLLLGGRCGLLLSSRINYQLVSSIIFFRVFKHKIFIFLCLLRVFKHKNGIVQW